MARKFHKTIIQVTVLSEEITGECEADTSPEHMSLKQLHYATTEGDCSGQVEVKESTEVSPKEMAKLLMEQGSDPAFFRLDDEGNDID